MSDIQPPYWIAFVSDNGRVIGIGHPESGSREVDNGIAVAILGEPVALPDWMKTLEDSPDLNYAVDLMLNRHGGERIHKPIDLSKATLVTLLTHEAAEA
jgi:hypothetical protein